MSASVTLTKRNCHLNRKLKSNHEVTFKIEMQRNFKQNKI